MFLDHEFASYRINPFDSRGPRADCGIYAFEVLTRLRPRSPPELDFEVYVPFFFLNSWLHIQEVVQNLVFFTSRKLVSPGLSPRTMQCLGSVQDLVFFTSR